MPSTEGTTTTHLACYPAHLDLPPAHVFLLFPISPARISVSNIRHPGGTERLYCVTGSERRPNRPSVKPFSAGSAPGHNRVPRAPPRGPVNRTRVTRSALTPPADRHRRARRKGTAARRARPGGARQSTTEHGRADSLPDAATGHRTATPGAQPVRLVRWADGAEAPAPVSDPPVSLVSELGRAGVSAAALSELRSSRDHMWVTKEQLSSYERQ